MSEVHGTLAELVGHGRVEHFVATCWPHRPYWIHDRLLAAALASQPHLRSIRQILDPRHGPVSLLWPESDATSSTDPAVVWNAYQSGATCYVRAVDRRVPMLRAHLDELADALGVRRDTVVAEVFCSSTSSGVAMHSDYDVNFALLLSGTKRWLLAENQDLVEQPGVCVARGPQPDPRVAELATAISFPDGMPSGSIQVDCRPGTMLFVPRGWWHETATPGPSLQVNLVLKGPTALEVVTTALGAVLGSDERARRFLYRPAGPPGSEDYRRAVEDVARLLTGLAELITADAEQVAVQVLATWAEAPPQRTAASYSHH